MWGWYRNPKPRKPVNGIKAKTQRGKFGQSWWAQKWIGALESFGFDWQSRLQRGRSYARGGQVLSIELQKGVVAAKVQGSMPRPYSITIQLPGLTDSQWEKVMAAMARQAIFAAKLLAGEMPPDIEEAFKVAGVSLFPQKMPDIGASCSCPDFANPLPGAYWGRNFCCSCPVEGGPGVFIAPGYDRCKDGRIMSITLSCFTTANGRPVIRGGFCPTGDTGACGSSGL